MFVYQPAERPQLFPIRIILFGQPHIIGTVHLKPALRTVDKVFWQPQAAYLLPFDFHTGKAVPDCIQKVEHHVFEIGQTLNPSLDFFGQPPFGVGAVRRRHHAPIQPDDRPLALAHLGKDMAVFLLDVGKEFRLRLHIAALGSFQNAVQLLRCQTFARVFVSLGVLGNFRRLRGRFRCIAARQNFAQCTAENVFHK